MVDEVIAALYTCEGCVFIKICASHKHKILTRIGFKVKAERLIFEACAFGCVASVIPEKGKCILLTAAVILGVA